MNESNIEGQEGNLIVVCEYQVFEKTMTFKFIDQFYAIYSYMPVASLNVFTNSTTHQQTITKQLRKDLTKALVYGSNKSETTSE